MTTNRFGASPVITGNIIRLQASVAAPDDTVYPNIVNSPIQLNSNSADQYIINTIAAASKTLAYLPAPSAQLEGKNFFLKIGTLGAASTGLTVSAPAFGTTTPQVTIKDLTIANDFVQVECQDQTPVGATSSTYGWAVVLCVLAGAWSA